ncbi:hypothetical protein WPS_22970 [Vulcanimicrobium alpinum]|uniref:DUF2029 domain-containing protein n=1 Tax=Vulcanimicrobium alpinum TaxID=3016050 RepID=A0AAN1XX61_UNVUL|nr:glycosyltransferase family 87 protein [Vulcanimicrobium alpinum]BDE07021.1 hypothetical protein WPS_22970 [Vulcanimicrobium alpinum]
MYAEPLRILRGRFWFWTALLTIYAAAPVWWTIHHDFGDWRAFAIAGSRAGTPALLHPPELWQAFLYVPAAAYAIAPLSRLPLSVGFAIEATFMVLCAGVSSIVLARCYRISQSIATALVFAWWPTLYAALVAGQNATFGLLCSLLTISGMVENAPLRTALPLGLLLYKPTYALPLVLVLAVRGRLREVMSAAAIGALLYVVSVMATGGDSMWPTTLAQLVHQYFAQDFRLNAAMALALPGLLNRVGAAPWLIGAICVLLGVASAVASRSARDLEAGSFACLAGLALSAHAWAYDAVLALPAIAWCATHLREPLRTRLISAVYFVADTALFSPVLFIDPLAIPIVGGTIAWLAIRLRGGRLHQFEQVPDEHVFGFEGPRAELDHGLR